ncbi:FmdB family zinc ribbon protein [Phaeovulum vinaykumarii]|uniref:Putative regulatory protein, FmdB family n=1 Tax=Phaeovulum vinaykumarii TaxID=407234 RepID=A0A1N7LKC0_9RHOB|nr:zinc ribbon domain-containing protein [Phaeovulum vinaykumarii]SIS74234.1 putative regulatory protein, FmdB family [Phaeovulum vinaykumarii]SOC04938.1 putative FmdB family regulatory protein [Phaeovulum vinaykumarii]
MPLYAYRCEDCTAEFEKLVSLGAEEPPACPECGSTRLSRLLSRVARPGQTDKIISGARKLAKAEGHFSNYSRAERKDAKI